jgi:hypothetical protein
MPMARQIEEITAAMVILTEVSREKELDTSVAVVVAEGEEGYAEGVSDDEGSNIRKVR